MKEIDRSELLVATGMRKAFGGVQAVNDVTFSIQKNQIKSLIGPNGAGKTTTLNLISGVYPLDAGKIIFNGRSLKDLPSYKITSLGISRTFQNGGLFNSMTVLDNLMLGFHCRTKASFLTAMIRWPTERLEERHTMQLAIELLASFGLADKYHLSLENLPLREQRIIEIASALAIKPKLLTLDEPSAGLNDTEIWDLIKLLLKLREEGISILLVEHNMDVVMEISDEIIVLNYGQNLAEGTPENIRNNDEVIKAYLGE